MKKQTKTKTNRAVLRITMIGMLAAVYYVLSLLSIPVGELLKFSIDSLPIIVGGMLFGPVDGMLIGGIGELLNQLIGPNSAGLDWSTPLWLIPPIARGLLVGLFLNTRKRNYGIVRSSVVIVSSSVLHTALNCAVLLLWYVVTNKSYNVLAIFGFTSIGKWLGCLITAIFYCIAAIPLVKSLKGSGVAGLK